MKRIKRAIRRFSKKQYTKRAMTGILVVALFDLQISYVLAFLGLDPLEEIAKAIVVEIIGVFLVYCAKSFFETKEEKRTELEKEREEDNDG